MAKVTVARSYAFKQKHNLMLQAGISRLFNLVQPATEQLLSRIWSNEYLNLLGSHPGVKAYKYIPESEIYLTLDEQEVYFPSRISRCIAEAVGEIIRSQYKRKQCFEAVRNVLRVINLKQDLKILVQQVAYTLEKFYNRKFKWNMIRQILQMIRRWVLKYNLDIWNMDYIALVKPKTIKHFITYGPDDNQAIKYMKSRRYIHLEVKIPRISVPQGKKDWIWRKDRIEIPLKLRPKIRASKRQRPFRPHLRLLKLKNGLEVPIFQFSWPLAKVKLNYEFYSKQRILAVDLGLINPATSVVCETGLQISTPYFLAANQKRLQYIERCYTQIKQLQTKISKYSDIHTGQGKRRREVTRIHAKLERCRKQDVFHVVNQLLTQATAHGCTIIVIEDLRFYTPPKNMSQLSRKLSNWVRGLFKATLSFKAKQHGIEVVAVNPAFTSSYCPRCTKMGLKIREPGFKMHDPKGRYFYCPHCQYCADRDYVGALNVYRVYRAMKRSTKKQKYTISTARPVFYKKTVSPPNRPGGKPYLSG